MVLATMQTHVRAASLSCAFVSMALLLQACGGGGGDDPQPSPQEGKPSCPGSPCCSVTSAVELESVCPGSPLLEVYGSVEVTVGNDGVDGDDPLGDVPAASGVVVTDETRQCGLAGAQLEVNVRKLEGSGSTSVSRSRFRAVHTFGTANVSVGALEATGSARTWQQSGLRIGAVSGGQSATQFAAYSNCASQLNISDLSFTGSANIAAANSAEVSVGNVRLSLGGLTITSASSWGSINVSSLTGALAISSVSDHGSVRLDTASSGSVAVSSVSNSANLEIGHLGNDGSLAITSVSGNSHVEIEQLDRCSSLAVTSLSDGGTLVISGGDSPSAVVSVSSLSSSAIADLKGVTASSAKIMNISDDATLALTMSAGADLDIQSCSSGGRVDVSNQSEVSVIKDGGCTSFTQSPQYGSAIVL